MKIDFVFEENGAVDSFVRTDLFGNQHYKRLAILEKDFNSIYSKKHTNYGESLYVAPESSSGLIARSIDNSGANKPYLYRLLANLDKGFFGNINSFLILKDGELVLEQYYNGWRHEQPHQLRSVSKSITSLLMGSAISQGFIESIDDPISKYLPRYQNLLVGGKEKITIQHLLTMSAGLHWNQQGTSYANPENINQQVEQSSDSVAFVLTRKLIDKPGDLFNYSDGYAYVAGEVIKNATRSKSMQAYLKVSTLAHLDLGPSPWSRLQDGRQATAYGLKLRPRDLAKIGQLLANSGKWHGKQVLPKFWIEEMTADQISTNSPRWKDYGFYWWETKFQVNGRPYNADIAEGFGGQYIIVIKKLNLVVVSTADNFSYPYAKVMSDIMVNLVIPAFH